MNANFAMSEQDAEQLIDLLQCWGDASLQPLHDRLIAWLDRQRENAGHVDGD